jgi:hypothetical protein
MLKLNYFKLEKKYISVILKEMSNKTLFQKIIDREIPSEIIYEDEDRKSVV